MQKANYICSLSYLHIYGYMVVDYECNKLHVGSIDVFAIKEITDGRLCYYDSNAEAVYINVAYLNNSCSLPEAVHIIAYECYN